MITRRTIAMAVAALAVTAQAALATDHARSGALRAAGRRLALQAQHNKGASRLLTEQEARRIDRLVQDLEAGRHVDPTEIERALERAEHPTF
jgi:hypothetical protein